jgi:hypothetical protein
VIVHHLRERQQRRRQKGNDEPKQTETDYACLFKNGHRDCDGNEKDAEREACPETRIISCCKRIEVVVGGESARPEKRFEVEQRHIKLCD